MQVRCDRCYGVEYLDEGRLTSQGQLVQCRRCGYRFKVSAPEPEDDAAVWVVTTTTQRLLFASREELRRALANAEISTEEVLSIKKYPSIQKQPPKGSDPEGLGGSARPGPSDSPAAAEPSAEAESSERKSGGGVVNQRSRTPSGGFHMRNLHGDHDRQPSTGTIAAQPRKRSTAPGLGRTLTPTGGFDSRDLQARTTPLGHPERRRSSSSASEGSLTPSGGFRVQDLEDAQDRRSPTSALPNPTESRAGSARSLTPSGGFRVPAASPPAPAAQAAAQATPVPRAGPNAAQHLEGSGASAQRVSQASPFPPVKPTAMGGFMVGSGAAAAAAGQSADPPLGPRAVASGPFPTPATPSLGFSDAAPPTATSRQSAEDTPPSFPDDSETIRAFFRAQEAGEGEGVPESSAPKGGLRGEVLAAIDEANREAQVRRYRGLVVGVTVGGVLLIGLALGLRALQQSERSSARRGYAANVSPAEPARPAAQSSSREHPLAATEQAASEGTDPQRSPESAQVAARRPGPTKPARPKSTPVVATKQQQVDRSRRDRAQTVRADRTPVAQEQLDARYLATLRRSADYLWESGDYARARQFYQELLQRSGPGSPERSHAAARLAERPSDTGAVSAAPEAPESQSTSEAGDPQPQDSSAADAPAAPSQDDEKASATAPEDGDRGTSAPPKSPGDDGSAPVVFGGGPESD